MDLAAFRGQFPEFVATPDDLVTAFLGAATVEMDPTTWGAYYDQGHGLLTAHGLTLSPHGVFARMSGDPSLSTYGKRYKELRDEVTCAMRVF